MEEDKLAAGRLAISPQTQVISRNLVFNINFHGPSCGSIAIDFDDESSQYNVTKNVLAYGGVKCFDGMDRQVWQLQLVFGSVADRISRLF